MSRSIFKKRLFKIVFFLSWFELSANNRLEHRSFIDSSMEFWTKIDLVRAINTTPEEKRIFLEEFIDLILIMHYKTYEVNSQYLDLHMFEELFEKFREIFEEIKDSTCYIVADYLLIRILGKLKAPINIQT